MNLNRKQKIVLVIGFIAFILRWLIFQFTDDTHRFSALLVDWIILSVGTGFFAFFLSHRKYLVLLFILLSILFILISWHYGYYEHIVRHISGRPGLR